MKQIVLILALAISNFAFAAGSKCFNGDQQILVDAAGGWSAISHIDLQYDLAQLIENGAKKSELNLGTKTFGTSYSGTDDSGKKVICVRIFGQAYLDSSCLMCAILN